jgi:alkyl hydroperoxide reductase subunit AhpC
MTDRIGTRIPDVNFKIYDFIPRIIIHPGTTPIPGVSDSRWTDKTTSEYFSGKRVVLCAVRGIYTPKCSGMIPGYNLVYDEIISNNIDEVYCMTVENIFTVDNFVRTMSSKSTGNVVMYPDGSSDFTPPKYKFQIKMISDGNKEFTSGIGMLTNMYNLGYGECSWRYAAVINDGVIEAWFEEEGRSDNPIDDPYVVTTPQNILDYLTGKTT